VGTAKTNRDKDTHFKNSKVFWPENKIQACQEVA
jgi:hypothetical protein